MSEANGTGMIQPGPKEVLCMARRGEDGVDRSTAIRDFQARGGAYLSVTLRGFIGERGVGKEVHVVYHVTRIDEAGIWGREIERGESL